MVYNPVVGPTNDSAARAVGLTKRFGQVPAVDNLNFSLERGVVTAFLGRNGAGKTTSVNLLCGLTPPNAGRA